MTNPKAIRELIPAVIQQAGEQRRVITQLRRCWGALFRKDIAAHVRPVALRRGTLYVQTDEPGAHFTMSLRKPELIEHLRRAGYQVDEIVVRIGEP